jgi:hypothetical protein
MLTNSWYFFASTRMKFRIVVTPEANSAVIAVKTGLMTPLRDCYFFDRVRFPYNVT